MALIKALESQTVHKIQSGQVIVDLCSVAKELVENSLDACATSIEVRFKNYGLDSIEVQDNGVGISPENYETLALKHFTSKLLCYEDLDALKTFGFRGEALSSLCALSRFRVTTAQDADGSKGTRLDFESTGVLERKSVVASQRGTTVSVEEIFYNLPVRRRELEKNIKREFAKVVNILHAYACICTKVKFTASNLTNKGTKSQLFATKANTATRDNILNVYGAKFISHLVSMDLQFELAPSAKLGSNLSAVGRKVQVTGHISRPFSTDGRLAPDRQMFFVNSRPCNLPQISKAFNEVYKSYNVSQSPFIFANILMDTSGYDVNVSPDKRSILLHDQLDLLENLKSSLVTLFEKQDQILSQEPSKLQKPSYTQSKLSNIATEPKYSNHDELGRMNNFQTNFGSSRPNSTVESGGHERTVQFEMDFDQLEHPINQGHRHSDSLKHNRLFQSVSDQDGSSDAAVDGGSAGYGSDHSQNGSSTDHITSLNARSSWFSGRTNRETSNGTLSGDSSQDLAESSQSVSPIYDKQFETEGVMNDALRRMRPRRPAAEKATITIEKNTTQPPVHASSMPRKLQGDERLGTRSDTSRHSASLAIPRTTNSDDDLQINDAAAPQNGSDDDASLSNEQSVGSIQASISPSHSVKSPTESSDGEYDDSSPDGNLMEKEQQQIDKLFEQAKARADMGLEEPNKRSKNLMGGTDRPFTLSAHCLEATQISIAVLSKVIAASESHVWAGSAQRRNNQSSEGGLTEEKAVLTISKSDFGMMQVVGQFNLGFILATRVEYGSPVDIFIVDQHASDEKYNFERLQANTAVQSQRLVRPQALQLTAIEEEIIQDRMFAIEKNGFAVSFDDAGSKAVGQRCEITALPMSKDVVFDKSDLEELLVLLSETPTGDVPRPGKTRRMFAMRACRSSIMVGRTLSRKQMVDLVHKMGSIEKPWNCPHGRPTMRHLLGLQDLPRWGEDETAYDWGAYDED